MSVGCWLSLRESHPDRPFYDALVAAVDAALAAQDQPPWLEPPAALLGTGRVGTDHGSGTALHALGNLADRHRQVDLYLLSLNPYWVAWLPRPIGAFALDHPVQTVLGRTVGMNVGAVDGLLVDLREVAPQLGIPIPGNDVDDALAACIDDLRPLPGEDALLPEWANLRWTWLLLWEHAKLAWFHKRPLVLH
jgi:hypothetical protein